MRRFQASSIRVKMFTAFVSAYIVVISIVGIIMYMNHLNEMKEQAQSLSNVLSTQYSRTIDLYFKDIERFSTSIFTDSVIQESLKNYETSDSLSHDIDVRNQLYPRLFSQSYPRRDIERVTIYTDDDAGTSFIYNKDGIMNVSHDQEHASWKEELDTLSKDSFMLLSTSKIKLANDEKVKVVSLVRHIYSIPQRKKIGSMKIDINVNVFERLLDIENVEKLKNHLRVMVLGNNQSVIYDQQKIYTGASHVDLDVPGTHKAEQSDGMLSWQSEQYLYADRVSEYTTWDTVVLIDHAFVIYERKQILIFIAITGIIAVLIIAVISYFLSHQIAKPLMTMTDRMKRVEHGHLHDRMVITGNRDMDLFIRVYNNMLDSINKLISEVYESDISEKNAKIAALQSQINPHFLYNTLNTMKSISRIRGVEEVAEISESLADLFKYSMSDLDTHVPLQEELKHIKNYMNIQRHRFRDRFTLEWDITSGVGHALIPKLIIQPLIENAINHGLADIKNKGIIQLQISQKKETIVVRVSDNGSGINQEKLTDIQSMVKNKNKSPDMSEGIGLVNIAQRIRLMYGHRYGICIESVMHKGTIVTLILPYKES